MTTTMQRAGVTISAIARLAADLTAQLLQPRRIYLKGKAPSSPYVHQLRRDISSSKARPLHMVLAVSMTDLDDRVPLSLVLQPYYAAVAVITEYARAVGAPATSRPLPVESLLPLSQRENRTQSEKDAAERQLLANPDSVNAHDRVLQLDALYDADNDRFVDEVRTRRAHLALVAAQVS